MYSTDLIIKIYAFMNLLFILLLLTHDYTYYLFLIELVTLYFGMETIRCMIEGNCYSTVLWIFILYIIGHLITFILLKGYFPETMKKIKKFDELLKKLSKSLKKDLQQIGYKYSKNIDKWIISDQAVDYIYIGNENIDFSLPGTLNIIQNIESWKKTDQTFPLFTLDQYLDHEGDKGTINFINVLTTDSLSSDILKLKNDDSVVILIQTKNKHAVADIRRFFFELVSLNWEVPVIIKKEYFQKTKDEFQLSSSTDIGSLLLDGFGDGVWLCSDFSNDINTKLSFGILQATRTRISKTEYISCPSCGRTLFDLQKVTGEIRSRTNHLKGVKIGIMGCIVNGPGEMADADYGYVGTGVGQISLYKGYEVVKRNIPAEIAVEALIDLIKDDFLFVGFGERDKGMIAQNPQKHPGSIIRIKTDGTIPIDNPA